MQVYCNLYMNAPMNTLLSAMKASKGSSRFLLSVLKDNASEPAIKRLDEILSLLVAAEGYRREQVDYLDRCDSDRISGIPEFLDLHRRSRESERAYQQTLEALNTALKRYRWEATVSGDIDGFQNELRPAVEDKEEWSVLESFLVGGLLKLTNKPGEVSRFRRCSDCHQWFYAVREHQHFCGVICRRRHEAQNPAFKEKRRVYMREQYRPQQKKLQELSIAIVNKTHQTKGGK